MRSNINIEENFFKQWSPEMAYILGFFIADGNLSTNRNGYHYCSFEITDKKILYLIKKYLGTNNKITSRKRSNNWKRSYRLQIKNDTMHASLLDLCLKEKKQDIIKLPEVPHHFIRDFIRGYFDGDGSVFILKNHKKDRKKPTYTIRSVFTCGNKTILETIRNMLSKKIGARGKVIFGQNVFRLNYYTRDSLKIYTFLYSKINNNLYLNRKKRVFEKFLLIKKRMQW